MTIQISAMCLLLATASGQIAVSGPPSCQQGQTCTYTASGGKAPYTFSLVSGSVGSLTSAGAYTAPARVVPVHVLNGCQMLPNNSIINTPIGTLPVNQKNALWLSNVDPNRVGFGAGEQPQNVVLSTDPTTLMGFTYTPQANGPFIFPAEPNRYSEAGTQNGLLNGVDNHYQTTVRDLCQEQEIYQMYPVGFYKPNLAGNSQSGAIYSMESFRNPGYGIDAAGMVIAPLMIHQSELAAAAAGNLNAIKHATRITFDTASINRNDNIWPAQSNNGSQGCQGNGFLVNTSGTSVTTTGGTFRTSWPAGMTVTINSVNYTLASVTDSTHLTLTTSAGTHTGVTFVQPNTNCPPYGARVRLKASYTWPGFDGICPTVACQNIVKAIIQQQKTYGNILADIGSSWEVDVDGGQAASGDVYNALREMFLLLNGNSSNYEIVDESSLETSASGTGTDITWWEAKLGNPFVAPTDSAVIKVSDASSNTATLSVALQGISIGVQDPVEVVMAGASPIQFTPWVTGSSNTGFTCSLSPTGGAYGTISSECLYAPASSNTVTTRTEAVVTVTSSADTSVSNTFAVVVLPVAADGKLYISVGKSQPTNYIDANGVTWWSDTATGTLNDTNLFPNNTVNGGGGSWTGANAAVAQGIYSQGLLANWNDMHFKIWVPNGSTTATVYSANPVAAATRQTAFSFDCNGASALGYTDLFAFTGALFAAAPMNCSANVTDGLLHAVVRYRGVNPQDNACCSSPIYSGGSTEEVAGIVISSSSTVNTNSQAPSSPLPAIVITSPTSAANYSTSSSTIALAGTASDSVGLSKVTWSTSNGIGGLAVGTANWNVSGIVLQSGLNQITLTVTNSVSRQASVTISVNYTPLANPPASTPVVTITSPTPASSYSTSKSTIDLAGTVSDPVAVTQVAWVTDHGTGGFASGSTNWSISGITLQSGLNHIVITASDKSGSQASVTLGVTYTPGSSGTPPPATAPPVIQITSPTSNATFSVANNLLNLAGTASDNVGISKVTWTTGNGAGGLANGTTNWTVSGIALQSGLNQITITAIDAGGRQTAVTLGVTYTPPDTLPPTITITSPTSALSYTSPGSTIVLAGSASDNVGIAKVSWANDRGTNGTASGTTNWTTGGIVLQNGLNQITITAYDAAGNQSRALLAVSYSATKVNPLVIATSTLPLSNVGQTYSATLTATGGATPYRWSSSSKLPQGLKLATNGSISGVPKTAGTYNFTFTVQDSSNNRASTSLTLDVQGFSLVSAATLAASAASPQSIMTAVGGPFGSTTGSTAGTPPPTTLEGCTVTVRDSQNVERLAPLYYVSPGQVNFEIPQGTAVGTATVTIATESNIRLSQNLDIQEVAPGLFALPTDDIAAAEVVRAVGDQQTVEAIAQWDSTSHQYMPVSIDLGSESDQVYLVLYGTGIRFRSSPDSVKLLIGGQQIPVTYAGVQGTVDGLDQVNLLLPNTLRGAGRVDVSISIGGQVSNVVYVSIR